MIPIVAGLLMGAAMGGGIAALQGKDVLQGVLMGGAGGALGGAFMPGVAGGVVGEGVAAGTTLAPASLSTTGMAETGTMFAGGSLPGGTANLGLKIPTSMGGLPASTVASTGIPTAGTGLTVPTHMANAVGATGGAGGGIGNFLSQNKYALAGGALGGMMAPGEKPPSPEQGNIREFEYSRGEQNPLFGQPGQSYYTGGGYTAGAVTPVEDYTAANGGIIALAEGGDVDRYSRPVRTVNPAVAAYNAQLMQMANQEYNVNPRPGPNQVPGSVGYVAPAIQPAVSTKGDVGGITFNRATGKFEGELNSLDGNKRPVFDPAEEDNNFYYSPSNDGGGEKNGGRITQRYNEGGLSSLGSYSDGGQLLKGPGDGVSDSIPARIGAKQPARLANNEFVVPARIVSEIGNGSTDAGARQLYKMMDRVQSARKKSIGKGKVAVDSKAHRMLPA